MKPANSLFHSSFFTFRYSLFVIHSSLLILLQSYCPSVLAQEQPADYQIFRQDATYFYSETEGWSYAVQGMRLDSSALTAEGTEWYNYHSVYYTWIEPEMYTCYHPDGPSWMGWKLLIKPNGDNVLYGRHANDFLTPVEDTILIRTNALPGDTWCYIHADIDLGPDTMATVTRYGTMSFLGITDSVKVIQFGGDSIILSKQHGLVRALNFRDYLPGYGYEKYELSGITANDTNIGVHLLKRNDIYNYEVGDIFHKSRHVDGWPGGIMYDVYEVLDKSLSGDQDSVYYNLSYINWYVGPEGTSDPVYDTIDKIYSGLDEYVMGDYFPNESKWDPEWGAFYEMWMVYNEEIFTGRVVIDDPYEIFLWPEPPDSCFSQMATYSGFSYIEGCGDLMHLYNDYHECVPCESLDYFKKGSEEWGTPFTIPIGLNELMQLDARIYPVPAEDFVMIEVNRSEIRTDLKITLSDLSGRIMAEKSVLPGHLPYCMAISSFEKGVYLLVISSGNRQSARKIVH
jgi:hypothetical protein